MGPRCGACGAPYVPSGRRRYCSSACRQRAHRARHARVVPDPPLARRPRAETVYACPDCEARYLGEQRCPGCNMFCRRVGPGGECPCCGEPVAISDLIDAGP